VTARCAKGERLSLNKVRDRLLHLLETEGRQGRFPPDAGLKSLAGELGVSHEALYRCAADMERRNFIRRDAGWLCLAGHGAKLT
jgi:CRP/FNR family transcriptional regulator, dissimilatory nitrate respiration regulator